MVMGDGDPTMGSSPETWEATVFPTFSKQIKEHTGNDVQAVIVGNFTTTSPVARAANEITLMSTMKNYFDYGMMTLCGIPAITLLGSEEDWVSLRDRAEALGKLMTPDFNDYWMPKLLPILDQFVESYRGNVNHGFWQSMVKLRYEGGSGASGIISGWIQIFFPYLIHGDLSGMLRPWEEMYFYGPDPDDIPPIVSSAPVEWDYYGKLHNLHFFAGFAGCSQDEDGTLTPEMGWYVAYDLPQRDGIAKIKDEVKYHLKVSKEEIEGGDFDEEFEIQAEDLDKTELWYARVSAVLLDHQELHGKSSFSGLLNLVEGYGMIVEQSWCNDCDERDMERTLIQEILNELDAEGFLDSVDESRERSRE